MALCNDPDCTAHYGCRLRKGGSLFSLGRGAKETRTRNPGRVQRPDNPSWEAGKAYDDRGHGVRMPLLNADLSPVHLKQRQEERHRIDASIARANAATGVTDS